MVMERAVKYSEKEGGEKVSHRSLQRALGEMRINMSITEEEVKKIQRPGSILVQTSSVGTPSEKRVKEHMASLHERVKAKKVWLVHQRSKMDRAKRLVSRMEKTLRS
jgi:hypothetical protein